MFYFRECMLFHTDFVEDVLDYPFVELIKFKLVDKYYESDKIDVLSIFEYCKSKYNYVNDEMNYFKNSLLETELKPYNIYFDVVNHKLIIPFDNIIVDKRIIMIGQLNTTCKDKIAKIKDKEIYFKI